MGVFLSVLVIVCIALSVPVSVILFSINKGRCSSGRLLGVAFLAISSYALAYLLFLNDWILYFPVTFRLFAPLHYLVAPCIYLYVLSELRLKTIRSKDIWWHFFLFFLTVIDLLPWLMMTEGERYFAVLAVVERRTTLIHVADAYIPSWIHFVLRPMQGMVYLCFQSLVILAVYLRHKVLFRSHRYRRVFRWVLTLTILEWMMYIFFSLFTLIMFIRLNDPGFVMNVGYVPAILLCLVFIYLGFYLYFNPDLLYGPTLIKAFVDKGKKNTSDQSLTQPLLPPALNFAEQNDIFEKAVVEDYPAAQNGDEQRQVLKSFSDEVILNYRYCLETEMHEKELYKMQGLTVSQLARICKIPQKAMAFLLVNIYHKRFNDFINDYRLDYVVEQLKGGEWQIITMEGLAFQAGFSSRATFYLAFKKKYDVTPTQFVKEMSERE